MPQVNELTDWQQRVASERRDLWIRLHRLCEFLAGDKIETTDAIDLRFLRDQRRIMQLYIDVLNNRLAAWGLERLEIPDVTR